MGLVRFLLALGVVFGHLEIAGAVNMLVGGRLAVECFYLISGFLISYVLVEGRYPSARKFYISRYLRLFPAYLCIVLLSLPVAICLTHRLDGFWSLPLIAKALLTLANTTIVGGDWVMFSAVKHGGFSLTANYRDSDPALYNFLLIPPSWTLGIELTFYAIAPFIIKKWHLLAVILVASIGLRLLAMRAGFGAHDPWSYRFFPFEIAFFIIGAFVHQIMVRRWNVVERVSVPLWLPAVLVCGLLVGFGNLPLPVVVKVPALLGTFIVSLPWLFRINSISKWDSWVGDLSYPIYIAHGMVIEVFRSVHLFESGWPAILQLVLVIGSVVLVAVLLKVAVTDRVEFYRRNFRDRTRRSTVPSGLV